MKTIKPVPDHEEPVTLKKQSRPEGCHHPLLPDLCGAGRNRQKHTCTTACRVDRKIWVISENS